MQIGTVSAAISLLLSVGFAIGGAMLVHYPENPILSYIGVGMILLGILAIVITGVVHIKAIDRGKFG